MASDTNDVARKGSPLTVVTFNCKNIATCELVLDELLNKEKVDILLLQEHWLFDCNLGRLNEISDAYMGQCKAVDTDDPILTTQMPRGYGGTAVLWKKQINHLVTALQDGGNRIQCVEVKGHEPILFVSVYMPCKGLSDNLEDFGDCVDQLNEIVLKYQATHKVIIGGDLNEDINAKPLSRRGQIFQDFVKECSFVSVETELTYVNPNGVEVSTIDHIIYDSRLAGKVISVARLDCVITNVSDHYPVMCRLSCVLNYVESTDSKSMSKSSKINWAKVDKDLYKVLLAEKL
ncbi:MAG: endonuclease/exonuclease/phosphatase family protein, partial [Candidatus Thiodiazotropha sp.]